MMGGPGHAPAGARARRDGLRREDPRESFAPASAGMHRALPAEAWEDEHGDERRAE
jgi:hypothetical protein